LHIDKFGVSLFFLDTPVRERGCGHDSVITVSIAMNTHNKLEMLLGFDRYPDPCAVAFEVSEITEFLRHLYDLIMEVVFFM